MRVLIFHAYLLRGTGSNVYNAELAQALSRLGHDVHLFAQDRRVGELGWVDYVGDWSAGSLAVRQLREQPGSGSITVYLPEIGAVLPVFVVDEYEGFTARAIPDMSDGEIESYLDANVAAVRDVIDQVGTPDAAIANHLVLGPVVLARCGLRSAVKVHGSDLSYAVRPHPKRFVPYANEGLDAAEVVVVGSRFTAEDLWKTMQRPSLESITRMGPPGVDVERFHPTPPARALVGLEALADRLDAEPPAGGRDAFGRTPREGAEALRRFASTEGPRALYVGKLLVNKGVDLLLAAWPLALAALGRNDGQLLIVGFGSFEDALRTLWGCLERGDLGGAAEIARQGRGLEGAGEAGALRILAEFLDSPPEGFERAAVEAAGSVAFAGRLDHGEVAEVLPAANVLSMPSTFPEAFGMVAAEAAACGVPPVSAAHSGMKEVSGALAGAIADEPQLAEALSFEIGPGAIEALAGCLETWLGLDGVEREAVGRRLADRVAELYSWEGVGARLVSAACGDPDKLPPVPD